MLVVLVVEGVVVVERVYVGERSEREGSGCTGCERCGAERGASREVLCVSYVHMHTSQEMNGSEAGNI